jgi:hypothetical protein
MYVQWEPSCYMRTDTQTDRREENRDMTKIIVALPIVTAVWRNKHIYCKNQIKHINTLYGRNMEVLERQTGWYT